MSLPRFHIPPALWDTGRLALTEDEARHCTQVLRRAVGDEVMVFNGLGAWACCRISASAKNLVELSCEAVGVAAAPAVSITLLQAVPKAGNMELIIEKAVELGASSIVPVLTDRTVVKLDSREAVKKREKWQRVALEACKQCGQNWLPHIHDPQSFETVWERLPAHDLRLIAAIQEDARSMKEILNPGQSSELRPTSVLMAIGPEGDFTPAEYTLARKHGCVPVTLGSIILRVETAALFCLSVLSYELRD